MKDFFKWMFLVIAIFGLLMGGGGWMFSLGFYILFGPLVVVGYILLFFVGVNVMLSVISFLFGMGSSKRG